MKRAGTRNIWFFLLGLMRKLLKSMQCNHKNNQMKKCHGANVICPDTVASCQHPASGIKLALGFHMVFHRFFHMLVSANVITGSFFHSFFHRVIKLKSFLKFWPLQNSHVFSQDTSTSHVFSQVFHSKIYRFLSNRGSSHPIAMVS